MKRHVYAGKEEGENRVSGTPSSLKTIPVYSGKQTYSGILPTKRKIIIGLGSGRCGTTTLSHLFNIQDNSNFTHELYSRSKFGLKWDKDFGLIPLCMIDMLLRDEPIVGDVSYYWVNYIPHVLSFNRDVKFICLKRDKKETVNSYMIHQPTNRALCKSTPLDFGHSMPRYPNTTREESLGLYYDEFYSVADKWVKFYPNEFKIFPIEALNTLEGQTEILDFAGFNNHNYCVGKRLNASKDGPKLVEVMYVGSHRVIQQNWEG